MRSELIPEVVLDKAHRAVIFTIVQLSCLNMLVLLAVTTQLGKLFYNPVSEVSLKLTHANFRVGRNFWSRKSLPLVLCMSDIIRVGAFTLSYFPETILYTSVMSPIALGLLV